MARIDAIESAPPIIEETKRPWRQRLMPLFLLTPGGLLLIFIFLWAIGILLSYSFYGFHQGQIIREWTFDSWVRFITDGFYWNVLWRTIRLGMIVTTLALLVGFPLAYALSRITDRRILIPAYIIIFSPLLVSVVVRSYGWMLLLSDNGVVNNTLALFPFLNPPYRLLFNEIGVVTALVHILLPFGVFPMISVLVQLPRDLKDAAMDLGATRLQTFYKVVLPMSLPGIIAATQIVFVLTVSALVTPVLLGGGRVLVISRQMYDNIALLNWPLAAIQAFVLLTMALTVIAILSRLNRATYAAKD